MTIEVAIDLETHLIEPGRLAPPIVCMSVATGKNVELLHVKKFPGRPLPTVYDIIVPLLEDDTALLVGHNVAFDMACICQQWPGLVPLVFAKYEKGLVDDTKIRERLILIAQGKTEVLAQGVSLAKCVKHYFDIEMDKSTWRLGYTVYQDTPLSQWPPGARTYAENDAYLTLRLYSAQRERYQVENWLQDSVRQTRGAWWIHLMAAWGMQTHRDRVEAFATETTTAIATLRDILVAEGFMRPNGTRAIKAVGARIEQMRNLAHLPIKRTASGQPATDDEACRSTGYPALIAYADFAKANASLTKDIPLLRGGVETPINPRFESLQATGRTGCSAPNLQNLKREGKARECFEPRENHVYVSADYSALELHTVAQVCRKILGHSRLGDALNDGRDPHLEMGAQLLGIPYADAKARKADPVVAAARQAAKVANFGFPGGMGIETFRTWARASYKTEFTLEQVTQLKKDWFTSWPEFHEYFKWVNSLQNPDETFSAVHLFSGRVRSGLRYTECCNTFFQGLAADLAKAAGFLISKACYAQPDSILYGSRIVNFIHDEFILESPEEIASECADELVRLMVLPSSEFLPDVPARAEPTVMRVWHKKAQSVRGANGKLSIWELPS